MDWLFLQVNMLNVNYNSNESNFNFSILETNVKMLPKENAHQKKNVNVTLYTKPNVKL